MSRSSFDYARQNRTTSLVNRRQKKFGSSRASIFSHSKDTQTVENISPEFQSFSIQKRLLYALIGLGSCAVVASIFTSKYPTEIKDVLITNSYLILLLPFFLGIFFLTAAATTKQAVSFLVSLFCTCILFLKLQFVLLKISLILPLFIIFVIIGMFYNRKSKA